MARRRVLGLSSGGGITNGAGNNVFPLSNGTNLITSPLSNSGGTATYDPAGVAQLNLYDGGVGLELISAGAGNIQVRGSATSTVVSFGIGGSTQWNIDSGGNWVPTADAFRNIGDATHRVVTTFTQNVRGITAFLTSNYTNATTTFSSVTGLSFPVAASQNYKITCDLDYQTSATTADIKIQWTGPTSPTAVTYDFTADLTATTSATDSVATAFSTSLAGTGTPTITTNLPLRTTMTLINGVNAGTVQLQAAATGTGTITIIPGSCVVTQ